MMSFIKMYLEMKFYGCAFFMLLFITKVGGLEDPKRVKG